MSQTSESQSLPALVAQRAAAAPGTTILRRKARGIWKGASWAELTEQVQRIGAGLLDIGIAGGDSVAIIAETRPETVYCDLAVQACGAASIVIHTDTEAPQVEDILRATGTRVAFVEGEEQLDKLLSLRARCPALSRIVIFDMKGLREFRDPQCSGLEAFAGGSGGFSWTEAARKVRSDQVAVILFPKDGSGTGRTLTHREILQMIAGARTRLGLQPRDERLAVLSMSDPVERIWGLYAALDSGCISNYLESADTAAENLQELQPTVLGADAEAWAHLHATATRAGKAATMVQRVLYDWAVQAGRGGGAGGAVANVLVLGAVRRELGLSKVRLAYTGGEPVSPQTLDWARSLGITIQRIEDSAPGGDKPDRRTDPVMQRAHA
ncbi:MAG: AMP-binding protein [Proteobacteria bacterium]|nr:AMP-binding protein [Pseudomonadota bacterium]